MLTKGPIPDLWLPYMRIIEFVAVIAALAAFGIDLLDRREERLARMWNLATSDRPGNSGKIPALEFLNREGKPLTGIEIPKAYLVGVELEGAILSGAGLSGADLNGADLSGADLSGADLSGANLSGARLRQAEFSGADLSGAYFYRTRDIPNLSQACLDGKTELQNLSRNKWPTKICDKYKKIK